MTTAGGLIAAAAARLQAAAIDAPRREARLILAHILGTEANELALDGDRLVTQPQAALFEALVARRAAHEPFAYLTGRRAFWSLELEVSSDTLIPRPETETLVETVLGMVGARHAPLEILDFGTGTGAVLLALLTELPNANGLGVDVSLPALDVARRNAVRCGVGAQARFSRSSWWSHVSGVFDIVVANPPYIPTRTIETLERDVKDFEPRLALDGGPDGLGPYRAILSTIDRHLEPGGVLAVEIGVGQADEVMALFRAAGFEKPRQSSDLAGIPRVISGALGTLQRNI